MKTSKLSGIYRALQYSEEEEDDDGRRRTRKKKKLVMKKVAQMGLRVLSLIIYINLNIAVDGRSPAFAFCKRIYMYLIYL